MLRMNGTIILALIGLASGPVTAQTPKGVQTVHTNRMTFSLPVRIDDRDRAELRELKFYVKALQGTRPGEWVCVETAAPAKSKFSYRAVQEGEYWFAFVTVDRAGRIAPNDLERSAPGLVVIVDTRAPEIDVQKLPASNGETFLQCHVRDANPDYSSIRLEYRGTDRAWHPLDALPDAPGVFRIPDASVLRGVVRTTAADKAGNQSVREIDLSLDRRANPAIAAAKPVTPPSVVTPASASRLVEKSTVDPPAPPMTSSPVQRQLLNGTHCILDYTIDATNVTRVECYGTKDQGKSWMRLGENTDRRNPLVFDLPDDGIYGLAVVVSMPGQAGQPPSAGDAPEWWVEIDTSKPSVQMSEIKMGTDDESGQLILTWSCKDKNLGPEPVELLWSPSASGPWRPAAKSMKAEGTARWAVPKDAGWRIYLRLEATDLAGNVGRWESSEPITMNAPKPKVRILGVSVRQQGN